MDDATFDEWTEALQALRQERAEAIENQLKEAGDAFKVGDVYETAKGSLDKVMMKWWNFEQQVWNASTPGNLQEAHDDLLKELDAVANYEVEAIKKDVGGYAPRMAWIESDIKETFDKIDSYTSSLKTTYEFKINALLPKSAEKGQKRIKRIVKRVPSKTYSTGSRSSGTTLFMMFFLGLLLGCGVAAYYWDVSNQLKEKTGSDLEKMESEIRSLKDQLALTQGNLGKIAYGKMKRIPEIQRSMAPIKSRYKRLRSNTEREYKRKKENLIKRIPAGDRLDRSLANLDNWRNGEIASINAREKAKLAPLQKDLDYIKALIQG